MQATQMYAPQETEEKDDPMDEETLKFDVSEEAVAVNDTQSSEDVGVADDLATLQYDVESQNEVGNQEKPLEKKARTGNLLQMLQARPKDSSVSEQAAPPPPPVPVESGSSGDVLTAFNLKPGTQEHIVDVQLNDAAKGSGPDCAILDKPVEALFSAGNINLLSAIPLFLAEAPLTPGGQAIFARLPASWLDLSERTDALSARCFFSARRHEHSVFARISPENLLKLPDVVKTWQPPCDLPAGVQFQELAADAKAFAVEVHPMYGQIRLLVRPGIVMRNVLSGGFALPRIRMTWRVIDVPRTSLKPLGGEEFPILSNIEDAAHTQPPHFVQHPLRPEQARSLNWMIIQERKRKDPFVAEFRGMAACPDAPSWRLEVKLACEYPDSKGGVLADAIGYGKTACTIGLVDCTRDDPLPEVPTHARGFIPSKATLVLVPTNLHAQWLYEIKKFVGEKLTVLAIPTCAQLKKLTAEQIAQADIVVATYRIFYSTPYLKRLEAVVKEANPSFAFPKFPSDGGNAKKGGRMPEGFGKAYRTAFDQVPGWVTRELKRAGSALTSATAEVPPMPETLTTPLRPARRGTADITPEGKDEQKPSTTDSREVPQAKRQRLKGKQVPPKCMEVSVQVESVTKKGKRSKKEQKAVSTAGTATASAMTAASSCRYMPLEAFWWKRVVCDEFHELLSHYPPAQTAVELFRSDYKWGLSGTPPCSTLKGIQKTASFFGINIPGPPRDDDVNPDAPRQVAQDWLDGFVRSNTAELPDYEEEEQIVPVYQSPKERALYLALTDAEKSSDQVTDKATDLSKVSNKSRQELQELQQSCGSTGALLQLCSHFNLSGAGDIVSAEGECERQLGQRKDEVDAAEKLIGTHADKLSAILVQIHHFLPHYCQSPDPDKFTYIAKQDKAALVERLKFLQGKAPNGSKQELIKRFLRFWRLARACRRM
eukprot:gnl/MRDRNA2_/MRDRNA2_61575_c0_seq1.p1 gnl/MRDRNA2_/MRDRNA2_61575_c0~~gnl/MRDRNA2_/MRDRNA2_61575_c0_seq1.p1  ORF type:complete len:1032 (-),score=237.18 gnl/MRDRNA2_/MRDRNA2_61575_c0_seq1:1398-4217(-)